MFFRINIYCQKLELIIYFESEDVYISLLFHAGIGS